MGDVIDSVRKYSNHDDIVVSHLFGIKFALAKNQINKRKEMSVFDCS